MLSRLLGDGLRQLTEQVVGDQRPALLGQRSLGTERIECGERALANRRAVDRQQPRDLVVAAATL